MTKVFERESGMDMLTLSYYPGMVELALEDEWRDVGISFNVSLADWRAMNKAVEAAHNGDNHDKER